MNYASGERGAKVVGFSSLFYPQKFFLQPLYDYFPVLGGYVWRRVTVDDKKARMVISDGWNVRGPHRESFKMHPRRHFLCGRGGDSRDFEFTPVFFHKVSVFLVQ